MSNQEHCKNSPSVQTHLDALKSKISGEKTTHTKITTELAVSTLDKKSKEETLSRINLWLGNFSELEAKVIETRGKNTVAEEACKNMRETIIQKHKEKMAAIIRDINESWDVLYHSDAVTGIDIATEIKNEGMILPFI